MNFFIDDDGEIKMDLPDDFIFYSINRETGERHNITLNMVKAIPGMLATLEDAAKGLEKIYGGTEVEFSLIYGPLYRRIASTLAKAKGEA